MRDNENLDKLFPKSTKRKWMIDTVQADKLAYERILGIYTDTRLDESSIFLIAHAKKGAKKVMKYEMGPPNKQSDGSWDLRFYGVFRRGFEVSILLFDI